MTVYITQELPGLNFLPAKDYGELKALLDYRQQVVISADPVVRQLTAKLSKFTDEDYLLLVGDPIIIGIALSVAAKVNHGRVNVLKWDRQEKQYYDVKIDLHPERRRADD